MKRNGLTLIINISTLLLLIILNYSPLKFTNQLLDRIYHLTLFFVIYFLIVFILENIIIVIYRGKKNLPEIKSDSFIFGISHIRRILIVVGLIIFIFEIFGVEFGTLITSLSIIAAAVALITREYLNDLIIGFYYSFSDNFEVDDYVNVAGHKGKILEVGLLKLKITNDDDDIVFIPNSKVYANEIINYTKRESRLMSIEFQMDTNKIKSYEILEQELIAALTGTDMEQYIEKDSFNLKVSEIKNEYYEMKFQYKLKIVDREVHRIIKRKIMRKLVNLIT